MNLTRDNLHELKPLIGKMMELGYREEARRSIEAYRKACGTDRELERLEAMALFETEPQVSLFCIDCDDEAIDAYLGGQYYQNLEVVKTESGPGLMRDLTEYAGQTESRYLCFLQKGQRCYSNRIGLLAEILEATPEAGIAVCGRNFAGPEEQAFRGETAPQYKGLFQDRIFDGRSFAEMCLENNLNLFGNLTCLAVRMEAAARLPVAEEGDAGALLFSLLCENTLALTERVLVNTVREKYDRKAAGEAAAGFQSMLTRLEKEGKLKIPAPFLEEWDRRHGRSAEGYSPLKTRKSMTFFYADQGEYYNLKPIADEAARRGYETRFTGDAREKAQIGVYCQHVCYPENSRFSMILLHDMAQGHNRWPDIWKIENWDKFDVGILPGADWGRRWSECAHNDYVNPRCGAYVLGYPKADRGRDGEKEEALRRKLNFKYDTTVLYAPSWENNEKEDDFVRALASLKVNLLIKHANMTAEEYAPINRNIEEMRRIHEGYYDNVYYAETRDNIIDVIALSDLIVSDESSCMTEALLLGVPGIAVTDWLIPDTVPPRFSSVPFDYVYKCKKVELREYVEKLSGPMYGEAKARAEAAKAEIFSNIGNCCKDILDAADYFTQGGRERGFMEKRVFPDFMPEGFWT